MKNIHLYFLICLAMCFAAATCQADEINAADLFNTANQAAINAEYEKAIPMYLRIAKSKGVSAQLLYNLAYSYAKTGQTGRAVANYERALRLDPGNEDILANLEQVRKDAGLYRDDSPIYTRLAELLCADQWLIFSATSFLLLAITLIAAQTAVPLPPTLLKGLSIGCLVITLLTLPPALYRYQSWNDGVVTGNDSRLLISPFTGADPTGEIKAGRLIRIKQRHGDFVLVEATTGKTGWLRQDSIISLSELTDLTASPKTDESS